MGRDWGRDEPERDAEDYNSREQKIIGYCDTCGRAIPVGEVCLDIDGTILCDDYDCIHYWLKQFKKN